MSRRLFTVFTAVVVGLAAAVFAVTPAQAACVEYADTPFWDGYAVVGNYAGTRSARSSLVRLGRPVAAYLALTRSR
jgi:hypothetical protein